MRHTAFRGHINPGQRIISDGSPLIDRNFCRTGDQFARYLTDAFDVLYDEGATTPKMMSVGLHCRLIGRPARFAGLVKFIDHITAHDTVWVARRIDIATHWIKTHPFEVGDQ